MPRPLITSPQSSDEEEESPQRSLVEGVIVDAKLLVVERKQGVAELESRAQQLALRLCYSNLQIVRFECRWLLDLVKSSAVAFSI